MTTNNAVNNDLSFPIIRTGLKDSNGNQMINFSAQASSVNYIQVQNAATGNAVFITSAGSDSNIPLTLNGIGINGVNIKGSGTNDSASAGYVGEYITSNIPSASATSLITATPKNVTSISLTAGDWDISGNIFFIGTTVTNPQFTAWTSITSATGPDASLTSQSMLLLTAGSASIGLTCPFLRVSIASTTTVYLTAYSIFSAGSVTACGSIFARRRR